MYNFALAFVACAVVYIIGEVVSNLTKAWVPSVFVTAAVKHMKKTNPSPKPPKHSSSRQVYIIR